MIVEEKFINKYKQEFYVGDFSIHKLAKEQKELLKILQDLNNKTQKYFDKACIQADRKVKSHRTTVCKENGVKLPSLIVEAELKNSQTYRQLLENEKNRLQKRMVASMTLKEKDMNQEIKMEKEKVVALFKNNKSDRNEIKKLGQKLIHEGKSSREIFDEFMLQIKARKIQNDHKQAKIQEILTKTQSLKQKTIELDYLIEQKSGDIHQSQGKEEQNSQKFANKISSLENNRDIIKKNVESVKHRLSQEYYCKLKQLEVVAKKGEELDKEIRKLQAKVQERAKEIHNHKATD